MVELHQVSSLIGLRFIPSCIH